MVVPPRPSASPPPAAAAAGAPALPRAGVGPRLAAYAVDLAAVGAVLAGGVLLGGWVLGVVLALEVLVILVVVESRFGFTPGKLVTRTRATTAGGDLAPGLRRGAVRAALFGAAHLAAGLGQVALLAASGRARAWHDRVAGTDVVSLRAPGTGRAPAAPANRPAVPAVPTAPAGVPAGVWPGTAAAGVPAPATSGAPAPWRPPELLDVPVSSDSISMREFRALREAAAGRPAAASRPAVAVPPRPVSQAQPQAPAQASAQLPPARPAAPDFRPPVVTAAPTASTASPVPPGPSAPGAPVPRVTRVVLTTHDGASHTITGSAVVGRRPRADGEDVQVVEIPDVARSLSRTHVRVRVADGVAWVEDAGSANGTRLRTADGTLTPLAAGVPVRLVPGAVLELGQVSLDVTLG